MINNLDNNVEIMIGISENVIKCYRLSKTVMIFALLDIFFGFFYAFFSLYYLIPLIISFYGYYSAKNYNNVGVFFYCMYQVLINILRISFATYNYIEAYNNDSITNYNNWNIILAIISTFLGLYISRFSYKLYKNINNLNNDDIESLYSLNYPINIIYW